MVFTVTPLKIKMQTIQYRQSRICNTHRVISHFFDRSEYILYILTFHRVKRCCIYIFTYAERWVLIYSIIVSRIQKCLKCCDNYVFIGKLLCSHVLFVMFTWVADQGPLSMVAFFRIALCTNDVTNFWSLLWLRHEEL